MAGQNELVIVGRNSITLSTPKGTSAGWTWTGSELRHSTGKALRFNAEITAAITEAVAQDGPHYETKRGYEIQDMAGWEYSHTEQDAHHVYVRRIKRAATITFAKEDLV